MKISLAYFHCVHRRFGHLSFYIPSLIYGNLRQRSPHTIPAANENLFRSSRKVVIKFADACLEMRDVLCVKGVSYEAVC